MGDRYGHDIEDAIREASNFLRKMEEDVLLSELAALRAAAATNALRDAKAAAWDRVVVAFDKPSEWFKANFWAKCRDIINDFRKSHSTWPRGAASKEGKDDA